MFGSNRQHVLCQGSNIIGGNSTQLWHALHLHQTTVILADVKTQNCRPELGSMSLYYIRVLSTKERVYRLESKLLNNHPSPLWGPPVGSTLNWIENYAGANAKGLNV